MNLGNRSAVGKTLLTTCCVALVAAIVLGRTVFRNETDLQFERIFSAHPIAIPGAMILVITFSISVDLRKALNGQVAYFLWLPIELVAIGYSIYLFVQGIKNAF